MEVYDLYSNKIIDKTFETSKNIILSDIGNFVVFNVDEDYGSSIDFFDDKGSLIKQVKPFKDGYSYYNGRYSNSGDFFIAVLGTQNGEGVIVFFNNQGKEIWRKDLKLKQFNIYQLLISEKGNYIYMAGLSFENGNRKYFNYCLDGKGNIVFSKDNGKIGTFSENEQYLCLSSDNEIELIEVRPNASIWKYLDPDSSSSVNSVSLLYNGEYTIFSMRKNPQIDKKKVIILDKSGNCFLEKNIISDKITKRIVVGFYEKDYFYIINGKQLEIYEITSKCLL